MTTPKKVQLGVLGAAKIARLFIPAAARSAKIAVKSVASRDLARAQAFAKEVGVSEAHGSYEAMLADPSIEAVYIPLPNNLHTEWAIKAADAGKHVLCEKPLCATEAEARSIFDAARRNNVYVVEGYPYRAQSQTAKVRELLASGAIGKLQLVYASFGFPLADMTNIRFDPTLAGGALMDAGSYPISFVRMVAGARPIRVKALARMASSGVDSTIVGLLEFESGLLAQISGSFSTSRHRRALIIGDTGQIETWYLNDTSAALHLPPVVMLRKGSGWDASVETLTLDEASGFFVEAESFADLVRGGWSQWPGATPEESIDIAWTIEALGKEIA